MKWTRPDFVAVGLDVSLTGTGIASSHGWCALIGEKGISTLPLYVRTGAIDKLAQKIIDRIGTPDVICIEAPTIVRTAGAVLERHVLWWKIVETYVSRGTLIIEASPTSRALYATGKGSASKEAVIDAVARRFSDYDTGGNNNLCDAVILCALAADMYMEPMADVPATHRKALDKVKVWAIPAMS